MKRCDFFERMLITFGIFGAIATIVESAPIGDEDDYEFNEEENIPCEKDKVWCHTKAKCVPLNETENCNILQKRSIGEQNPIETKNPFGGKNRNWEVSEKDNPIENLNLPSQGKSMIDEINLLEIKEQIEEMISKE